jgi:hypothetical protein
MQSATTTSAQSSGVTGGGGAGAATGGSGGGCSRGVIVCQGHVYQCGDGIDDDGDGLIDEADPDCTGPCDNTEDSFYGGIPGQSGSPCIVDCYFDQDSGSGNDDCHWTHKCDPYEVPPNYYPEPVSGLVCAYDPAAIPPGTNQTCVELSAAQSPACNGYCGPLTPNGCDCFGCCELPAGTGQFVWLGSEDGASNGSCSLSFVADPTKCHPCTPVPACLNACDHCELCIGKSTLPDDCGGAVSCNPGVAPCAADCPFCPNGTYCITGCCQPLPT